MKPDTGSWVLVTGAARRIGRAIALELATQGWNTVVHYNHSADEAADLAKEIEKMGRQVVLAEIDLTRTDHVAKLIPSLVAELGPLGALVNNASLFVPDAQDQTRMHHAINVEAPRILSETFYHQVPAEGKGTIVNLLDGVPPEKGFVAYKASKAELKAMTFVMAQSFAPRVRVNGIAPGPALPSPRQSGAHFQSLVDFTPLKSRVTPEDIARGVYFLLSLPAITGEVLHIDGGMHMSGISGTN